MCNQSKEDKGPKKKKTRFPKPHIIFKPGTPYDKEAEDYSPYTRGDAWNTLSKTPYHG